MGYKVPFINPGTQFNRLEQPIMETIRDVLSRGDLILRGDVREFEKNFASFVGTEYAVGVGSGTDAIHLALRAIGFDQNDEVITVSHTCIATVSAVVNCGAQAKLVEVGDDFNMDMDELEQAITSRTRAVVPVHLNGRSCDMARLMSIAEKHDLMVIEDAGQALGARFDGRMVGSFGLAGCFSLYPLKMLGGIGDAGMIVTNDGELARDLSFWRDYGQDRETGEFRCFGFNARLDNVNAAVLNVKLQYVPEWIERRREIARMYDAGLSDIASLRLPIFEDDRYFDVYQNYVIRTEQRDSFIQHLKERGVETLISLAKPVHLHNALGFTNVSLPQTEKVARELVCLPDCPELTDDQVHYVIDCVRDFFEK